MNWNTKSKIRLIQALLSVESEHLMKIFLEDLLTEKEVDLFSRRLVAAELILYGTPYSQIQWITGLSSTTIARISKLLVNKSGGFQEIFTKLKPHGKRYVE